MENENKKIPNLKQLDEKQTEDISGGEIIKLPAEYRNQPLFREKYGNKKYMIFDNKEDFEQEPKFARTKLGAKIKAKLMGVSKHELTEDDFKD